MSLSDTTKLIRHAAENGYAVAMVNTNGADYDILRALTEVAEEEKAPIIFGAYEANLEYRGFEYAGCVMNMLAENASVPIASHLDHSTSVESCRKAIEAGFTSVMIDGSKCPIDENITMEYTED